MLYPAIKEGLGFDATVPFWEEWRSERAHYPVDRIDLRKWLSEEQLAKAQAKQSDYARILAKTGR